MNVGLVACHLTGCRLRGIGLVTVGSLKVGSVTGTRPIGLGISCQTSLVVMLLFFSFGVRIWLRTYTTGANY